MRRKQLLYTALQSIAVLALSCGVVMVAMGLLPRRVEAWLRSNPNDEQRDHITCPRCGGSMEVRNRLAHDLKVYGCTSCRWALWPDNTWKPPPPERDPPATWHGDR